MQLSGPETGSILLACAMRYLSKRNYHSSEVIMDLSSCMNLDELELTKEEIENLLKNRIETESIDLNQLVNYSIEKFKKISTNCRISLEAPSENSALDSMGSDTVTKTEGSESSYKSLSLHEMELPNCSSYVNSLVNSRRSSARGHRYLMTPRKSRPRLTRLRMSKTKSMDTKRKWVRKDSMSSLESVENEIHPEFSFGNKEDYVHSTKDYYKDPDEIIENTSEKGLHLNLTERNDTEITEFIISPKIPPSEYLEMKHFYPISLQPQSFSTFYPITKPKIKLDKLYRADLIESPAKRHKRSDTRHTYKNSIFSDLSCSSYDCGPDYVRVVTVESDDRSQTLEYSDSNPGTPTSPISGIRVLNTRPDGRPSLMGRNLDNLQLENEWDKLRYEDPLMQTKLRVNLRQDTEEDSEGSVMSVEEPMKITKVSIMYEEDEFQKSTQYLQSKIDKLKEKIKNLRHSEISEEISVSTERNRDFDINSQNVQDLLENYPPPERASVEFYNESKTATMEVPQGELHAALYKDLLSSRNFNHEPIVNIENIDSENHSKELLSEGSSGMKVRFDESRSCHCSTCSLI